MSGGLFRNIVTSFRNRGLKKQIRAADNLARTEAKARIAGSKANIADAKAQLASIPRHRGAGLRAGLSRATVAGGLGAGIGYSMADNQMDEAAEMRAAYERSDPSGRARIMADVYLRDNPDAMEHMKQALGTDDPEKVLALVSRTMVNTMRRSAVDTTQLGPEEYLKLAEMAAGGIPQ